MRFYALVNFYLSSIQQGIQAGHALGELIFKYSIELNVNRDPGCNDAVCAFLRDHKTWVVLNGGTHDDIKNFHSFIREHKGEFTFPIPYAPFCEDMESLGGILTCVGLILPEAMYDTVRYDKVPVFGDLGLYNPNDYVQLIPALDGSGELMTGQVWHVGTPDWELIDRIKSCPLAK